MKGSRSVMESKDESAKDPSWFPRHTPGLSKEESCPEDAVSPTLVGFILSGVLRVQTSEFQVALDTQKSPLLLTVGSLRHLLAISVPWHLANRGHMSCAANTSIHSVHWSY